MSANFDGRPNAYGDHRDIVENVVRIREALRHSQLIMFRCFSESELNETRSMLTVEERDRVSFTCLIFQTATGGTA